MTSAVFELSSDGGATWLPPDRSIAGGYLIAQFAGSKTIKARLVSQAGVGDVRWSIKSKSVGAATFTVTKNVDKSATMLVPCDTAAAWLLECVVNNGIDPKTGKGAPDLVRSLAIKVATAEGFEFYAPGEEDETDRANGWSSSLNAFIAGAPTGGVGTNTRARADANAFLSGDITFSAGTGIELVQAGQTILVNATGGGGGGALPGPWTATVNGSGDLTITVPAPSVDDAHCRSVLIKAQSVDDTNGSGGPDAPSAADAILEGGDTDSFDGNSAGNGIVRGGNGSIAGQGIVVGGRTTEEGGTGGHGFLRGRDGADHTTLTNVNGGDAGVYGGAAKGTGYGGAASVLGGDAPGSTAGGAKVKGGYGTGGGLVEIEGGDGDDGVDINDGHVHIKGGGGNNIGTSIRAMAGDGDAGSGGDLEMFAGFGSSATDHGAVSFGLGNASLDFASAERFAKTYPRKNQTTNATPATVFSEGPVNHQLITIVSVSQARTTSAGDGGLVVRRSTWRNNGGVVQVGTTKPLSESDEDNGFDVTHTYGSTVDVKAVGKAATTVEWRHTIQVFYHSVGS